MRKSVQLVAVIMVGAFAALVPDWSEAQSTLIRLRAIGPHANDPAIIRYIARNAQPSIEPIPETDGNNPITARSIITRRCGSVQSTYVEEFQAANRPRTITLDQSLGKDDSSLIWPACLHVAIYPNGFPARVRKDERASHVYVRLTGGGGSEAAIRKFFAATDPKMDVNNIRHGTILMGAHVTQPVYLRVEQGNSGRFWPGLEKAAKESEYWRKLPREVAETARVEATMIAPLTEADVGAVIVATDETCEPSSGAPYNVSAVLAAYDRAQHRASTAGQDLQRARITVVDNGFFGADPANPQGKEFDGSPFHADYFAKEAGSALIAAPIVLPDKVVYPINFSNKLKPDSVTGHGTHVTGLVLGGPSFRDHWSKLRGRSWAEITVLNVGAGQRDLIKSTEDLLMSKLAGVGGRIVNMSITYPQAAATNISTTFERLFSTHRHLYVAAAGNRGSEVSTNLYPAASGGAHSPNVITVAALDNTGRFARFSNTGADTVDMAAPGCEISSWIQNTVDQTVMSGTSQAAPLVSFAAALLRTFTGDLDVRHIKTRLVVSGSLLDPRDQDFTAYRVGLNIPRALYWFDDYVRVRIRPGEHVEYIGTIDRLAGLRCTKNREPAKYGDVWAFKRGFKSWLYLGKHTATLRQSCEAVIDPKGEVAFTPAYLVTDDGLKVVEAKQVVYQLGDIDEVISRSHPR